MCHQLYFCKSGSEIFPYFLLSIEKFGHLVMSNNLVFSVSINMSMCVSDCVCVYERSSDYMYVYAIV